MTLKNIKISICSTAFNCLLAVISVLAFMVGTNMAQAFKHPGIRNSREELDLIKARVNAGQEPQKSGWDKMMSNNVSSPGYKHQPCASFTFDGCRGRSMQDSAAAYSNAMQWYVKGDTSKADKAITIINDWARVTSFKQSCLAAGWSMPLMINAAEIMRMYPGWKSEDQAKFKSWLSDKLWPFASGCNSDKSNWDCGGIALSLAIAVFTDNRSRFEDALGRLRSFMPVYVKASGCTNETDRDQGHAQMGIGHLAAACEVAWHQGVDAWSHLDNRMFKGYEINAKYNLGESISCPDVGGVNSQFRGNFGHTMWEIAYNHYHNRKKMNMPYTARALSAKGVRGTVRPETLDNDMLPWGTLFHAELGDLKSTPPPVVSHTIDLKPGWNLISLPLAPSEGDIAKLLSGINGKFEAVYAWNGKDFEAFIPGDDTSSLKRMDAGRGYWIYITEASSLQVTGVQAEKTISLSEGWNLVGFSSTSSMPASQALTSAKGKVEAVFSFNPVENSYLEVETFQPGAGYWVYATESVSWTLP
jgi:hypothetical protein